jgi:hypothetical protein
MCLTPRNIGEKAFQKLKKMTKIAILPFLGGSKNSSKCFFL